MDSYCVVSSFWNSKKYYLILVPIIIAKTDFKISNGRKTKALVMSAFFKLTEEINIY